MSTQFATRPAPAAEKQATEKQATQTQSLTQNPVQKMVEQAVEILAEKLAAYSVPILRVSLGLVFLVFGAFKFVPGFSPAEDLAIATVEKLTLGLVSGQFALVLTAVMEVTIGLTLVSGRFLKTGLIVLATAMGGILAPLVLFPGELYLDNGVTLTAQYVFKDIVLVAAGMVVAAQALGARLRRDA